MQTEKKHNIYCIMILNNYWSCDKSLQTQNSLSRNVGNHIGYPVDKTRIFFRSNQNSWSICMDPD